MHVHWVLISFRDDVDREKTITDLRGLLTGASGAAVLSPHDAEAKRSWHACLEARGEDLDALVGSAAWKSAMELVVGKAEVYKAWTFAP